MLYSDISFCGLFEGLELYRLLTHTLSNPKKLLPESTEISDGESLQDRLNLFFKEFPEHRENIADIVPGKLKKLKELVRKAKAEGRKVIVATEYKTDLTDFLQEELAEFGCVKIDEEVPANMEDISLTGDDIASLKDAGLHEKRWRKRSDLSQEARDKLGYSQHDIYEHSERMLTLLEFQTNPDTSVVVATYGTLREGIDLQEAGEIIEYEPQTVPGKFLQLERRPVRPGQRKEITIQSLVAENTLEEGKVMTRRGRAARIEQVTRKGNTTLEELEELAESEPVDNPIIGRFLRKNPRYFIAEIFGQLNGKGLQVFLDSMNSHQNAFTLAKTYSYNWEFTYSADCARMIVDIIKGIEKKGISLDKIVDEGAGPATISRLLDRKTTNIDVNGYQLHFGQDACEDMGIESTYLVGSYTNMKHLTRASQDNTIYNPELPGDMDEAVKDNSTDMAVCSLALDFANDEEKKQFFSENKRILKKGGYLLIVNPTSKMDKDCREQFLKDIADCGYTVDTSLTGVYKARQTVDVDSGQQIKNGFEAYVIVAMNSDESNTIEYEEDRSYFQMKNEYTIVESGPGCTPIGDSGNGVDNEMRRISSSRFYNQTTGKAPDEVDPIRPKEDVKEFRKNVNSMTDTEIEVLMKLVNITVEGPK
jgi:SAM-dependent methyltransferase/predicted house-cleaning noncanonical NTP pyrophosphatase (MazG superfamily)